MFENQCNQSDAQGWGVGLMLSNVTVVQVLLYSGCVWGGTNSHSTWNEIRENTKNVLM